MSRQSGEGQVGATEVLLLGVAVAAVSTSAPLTRLAAAPALAIAFWRNAAAGGVLVPTALAQQRRRSADPVDRRTWAMAGVAGVLLGAHFAAWISSLSLTSVAASVALVSTQPVWASIFGRFTGERLDRSAWLGIGLALAGVAIATGTDVGVSGRALRGDLLALAGGVLAAAYMTVGAVARRRLSTTDYTAACYSVAAVELFVAALAGGAHLTGFSLDTWLCIAGITIGPQFLGHSVFNRVLRTVGPVVVSVAVLGEIVGSSLLAAWWLGQRPAPAIIPAAVCIGAGVVLVVRGRQPGDLDAVEDAIDTIG